MKLLKAVTKLIKAVMKRLKAVTKLIKVVTKSIKAVTKSIKAVTKSIMVVIKVKPLEYLCPSLPPSLFLSLIQTGIGKQSEFIKLFAHFQG